MLPPHRHFQRLPVIPQAVADFAGNGHIRQKLHLNLVIPLPLASLAAPPLDIERKPPRLIPPNPRLRQTGEQLADGSKRPGIGSRIAPRRPPDGRLVDLDHLIHIFDPQQRIVVAGQIPPVIQPLVQLLVQNFIHQAAFPRTRHPRNAHQPPQRKLHINAPQVVFPRPLHRKPQPVPWPPLFRRRHPLAPAEILPGKRIGRAFDFRHRAGRHHLPPVLPRPRPQIGDIIRRPHHRLIVFHHQHRIPHIPQPAQGADQPLVIVRMQPHRRLIAHIQHPRKPGADLRRQPHPLRLAPG